MIMKSPMIAMLVRGALALIFAMGLSSCAPFGSDAQDAEGNSLGSDSWSNFNPSGDVNLTIQDADFSGNPASSNTNNEVKS